MSNAYKDWLWDHVQDIVLERGLVDKIIHVEPTDPAKGEPQYIWGIKNGKDVKYYVHYDPENGWLCEHQEFY